MKRVSHRKTGAPAWMTTFADLMALMLTFFVLMLALSKIDALKYEQAMLSIQDAFGLPWHGRLTGTGSHIGERGIAPPVVVASDVPMKPRVDYAADSAEEQIDPLFDAIRRTLEQDILETHIELEQSQGKIIISFPEHISFPTASADLQRDFIPILDRVAKVLQDTRRKIVVVGHTDNRPITTPRYRSNWDLSAARASSVVHHLLKQAPFSAKQIIAQGRADSMPLVDNGTAKNRAKNRRVELIITSEK
jgi:chemotaxis protein MotB